jgi:hypothetical protein
VRVTVRLDPKSYRKGTIVSPNTPRVESGIYWGYQVRYANAFRKIIFGKFFNFKNYSLINLKYNSFIFISESSFDEKYDLKIAVNNRKICFDHIKDLPNAK